MHLERSTAGQLFLRPTTEEWRVKTRHAPAWFKRGDSRASAAARAKQAEQWLGWIAGCCTPGVSNPALGTRDKQRLREQFTPAALEQILAEVRSGKQKPTLTWGHGGQVLARAPIDLTFRVHSLCGLEFMARLPEGPVARRAIEAAAGEGLAISIGFASKRQWITEREGVGRLRVIDEATLDHVAILPPDAKLSPVYAGARCFGKKAEGLACPVELLKRAELHVWPLLKEQARAIA